MLTIVGAQQDAVKKEQGANCLIERIHFYKIQQQSFMKLQQDFT